MARKVYENVRYFLSIKDDPTDFSDYPTIHEVELTPEQAEYVGNLARMNSKIEAIKFLRIFYPGVGLKEGKDFVELVM